MQITNKETNEYIDWKEPNKLVKIKTQTFTITD